jgi:hypothetical protein
MTATKTKALPFTTSDYECCYACDGRAVGLRDRRPEGGRMEKACARHAEPSIRVFQACMYCMGPVRKGSIEIDGAWAHASCHREACK